VNEDITKNIKKIILNNKNINNLDNILYKRVLAGIKSQAEKELEFLENLGITDMNEWGDSARNKRDNRISNLKIAIKVIDNELSPLKLADARGREI
jgi:hypothetical protein